MNDLYKPNQFAKACIYAGDTSHLYSSENAYKLRDLLNNESVKISRWFAANQIIIFEIKPEFLVFHWNKKLILEFYLQFALSLHLSINYIRSNS